MAVVNENVDKYLIELGQNIKSLRLSKKMTQLDLSIDSNIPLSQIGAIESGKQNTTVKTLIKITESLDVKVKDVISF